VHFLQIWILPRAAGLSSGYEQKHFADSEKRGRLRLVASPDGADGSVRIQQDARMFATLLVGGQTVSHSLAPGRKGWLHVARGTALVNGTALAAGDGVAIEDEAEVRIGSNDEGEVLLFDMAG
jgi:hypothetical protein